MLLAEANQWPADVRPYFGDGDECHMAFHFPLMPRMFMARAAGRSPSDHRDPAADAGDSRQLPVGDVPAQPRRADARDGHRRGARLHVPGVRGRSADADQRRHPPPPGAAAGEQPPPHRAAQRAAVLAARHAGHLLRRRNRHGRQHLSGDRNGVRTPMQWTGDRNGGFSRADPARLYAPPIMDPVYGYQASTSKRRSELPSRCSTG